MAANLLIVESPSKAKTLKKYLGKDYEILASYGHVRDLVPKSGAVDPEDNFRMKYELIDRNTKHVDAIAKAVKSADTILLATDPDREGEAIAWHLSEILKGRKALKDKKLKRVVFYEITEGAVKDAVKHPRAISMDAGERAAGAPRARLPRRIQPLAAALEEDPPRPFRRAACRARRCGSSSSASSRSRSSRARNTGRSTSTARRTASPSARATHPLPGREARPIRHRERAARAGDPRVPRAARQGRGEGAGGREEAQAALARRAIHDFHAAAGGGSQARLLDGPRDEGRAEPLRRRGRRQGGDRPHHLHAHRFGDAVQGSAHGDARLHHEELRARLPSQEPGRSTAARRRTPRRPTRRSARPRSRARPSRCTPISTTSSASSTR